MPISKRQAQSATALPGTQPAAVISPPGPWARQALCARIPDPEIFFPHHDDQGAEAKAICRECPVHEECLRYAIGNNERHGIWGGLDPAERASLRRPQRDERDRRKSKRGAA